MTVETTPKPDDNHDECPGHSCCVFPLILAFMFGALLRQGFRWFRIHCFPVIPPYTLCVIITGGLFALCVEQWPALKAYHLCLELNRKSLVYVCLPLLVFNPTFKTEMATFKRSLNQVLFLAVTGYALMLLMTAVVVKLLFYSEWSYYKSIIFGIIVSATDPIAVDDAVKVTGVSVDLAALLKGESIVGGATGMICLKLFRLLQILDNSSDSDAYKQGITLFAVQCLFAPMYGIIAAIMTVFWVSRIYNDTTLEITIVLSVVHLVYYTSELLRLPGMLTVLFYGLYLSSSRASISHTVESTMKKTFQVLTDIHNSVLFFYAGVFMVMDGFTNFDPRDVLNYILIWAIVNITRVIMVFFVSPVLRRLGLGMSWEHALTVWVAGLNGVFNILLALMSTHDLRTINDERAEDSAQYFQTTMAVIFLKLILNTSLTRYVLSAFGLRSIPVFHQKSLVTAMRRLKVTRSQTINSLKCDRFMADAAFDVVESQTQTEDMFKHFRKKKIKASRCCRRFRQSTTIVREAYDNQQGSTELEESMENKAEAIQMLLKAQKKTYWEHFDRGLMSKEALHQLIEWADSASDHKGKYLDVRKVKQACQVPPFLRTLKRQVKVKLRQLQQQKVRAMGWLFWQQQVLMVVLSYGFHLIDTVAMVLAIVIDLDSLGSNNHLVIAMTSGIFIWNCVVVGLYGMIALGELLVMRLRFFKIVWHDITLMIVVMGMVDLIVNSAMSDLRQMQSGYRGRLFIRLIFIISRNIRLLSMVETVPCLLRSLIKLLEKRISGHLGVGFDICCAYVTGQGEVVRQLDSMVNEPSIRDDLKHTCNRHKMDIIRTLGILALENPTIALSVKTRQAMRIVLNAQHDTVMQLKGDGALLETDASLLSKDLEERMKRVLNSPPLVDDDSLDNIVKNLGWVQGDDELFRFLKDNLDIYHLKANSAVAEQDSEDFNIYIIGSGVGRLEHITGAFDVNVLDYLTAGNTVGELSFLTKSMRHKTVRCETAVTVLALREEVMERVLKMKWNPDLPPVLYRMWLVIAKRVAIKVILDNPEYQGMSTERLRMQIYNGFLIDDQVGTSFAIHSDPADAVILIHGYARDAFTRQPFQGPCFIPSSCFQLTLLPEEGLYTLVLVIPNEPVELAEYNINPTRRGSQIDASVLGLASEGNTGMRLEDICRNSATPYRDEDVESSCRQATRASESDDEAMSSSCSSDEGASYGQHSETHSRPEQQEVIISHPSEAAGSTNKLHPPPQHRSHVPAGATWEISDTWDRMTSLLQSRPDNRKISDADKRFKSSGSDDSGSDD